MTSSPSVVRRGSQRPRIEHVPLFHTTAADDAVDLAALAGLPLLPWQEHVLRGALGERVDGRWSAFRTCLVVPRQNGKNAILEARELAGIFLFGERQITHTAHQFKTAKNSMLALMNRLKNVPDLMEHVVGYEGPEQSIAQIDGFKTGNEPGIYLKNGHQIQYFARSGDSARGFTGDVVVLDEAYALKASEMGALLPTMAAKSITGNPQLWITSSAGKVDSEALASIRAEGVEGTSNRLAYYEWSADPDAAPDDVDSWYEGNPSAGYLISEEFMWDEYDSLVRQGNEGGPEEFQRERQGIWARIGGESVLPAGTWSACGDPDGQPDDGSLVFGVDVSPARDTAAVGLASLLPDGRVHVEVPEANPDTGWVADYLVALKRAWPAARFVCVAGSQAESLVPEWRKAGVVVKPVQFSRYVVGCGLFYDRVVQARLQHLNDPVLTGAVDGAKQAWRQDKASWYWSRKESGSDITPLVAVTAALTVVEKQANTSVTGGSKVIEWG